MSLKAIHINNPDEPGLADAYRSLPRIGEITVSTLIVNLNEILRILESTGFIGMEVVYFNYSSGILNIRAFKGKNGPCYNTGRKVLYQGEAVAALDDDNHLIFGDHQTPVCEKTAIIYRLPGYKKLVKCSDANPDLLEKLDDVPEDFQL